jgi:dTDP-4-amino-4,6-dideoxygalactose transaminase
VHRQPALNGLVDTSGELRNAEAWAREELSLPMSPKLTPAEIRTAADACLAAVATVGAQQNGQQQRL